MPGLTIMWTAKSFLCVATGLCIALIQITKSQECNQEKIGDGFIFPRTFTVLYDGPPQFFESKEAASDALGHCVSAEMHAENMIKFFSSYGVNLTKIKQDPYLEYEEPDFYIAPGNTQSTKYRIHSGSFFDYTKYMNTPLRGAEWSLVANATTSGPSGTLQRGDFIYYGTFRFKVHGRYFCIQYQSRIPVPLSTGNVLPLDSLLYNEFWGMGAAIGLIINGNKTVTHRYLLTFPAVP